MSDNPEQRAWVSRVLGISLDGADPSGAPERFKDAYDYIAVALPTLINAPDLPQFTQRFKAAGDLFQAQDFTRGLPLIEALRDDVASARSRARGREAATVTKGAVGRAKLALAVRNGHAEAVSNLKAMGDKLLALKEVQQDEQLPEVKAALKRLEGLIPPLDNALAKALEQYDAAQTGTDRARVGRDALALLQGVQRKLVGSTILRQIERFAAADLGGLTIAQDLRATLAETATELRQATA